MVDEYFGRRVEPGASRRRGKTSTCTYGSVGTFVLFSTGWSLDYWFELAYNVVLHMHTMMMVVFGRPRSNKLNMAFFQAPCMCQSAEHVRDPIQQHYEEHYCCETNIHETYAKTRLPLYVISLLEMQRRIDDDPLRRADFNLGAAPSFFCQINARFAV